MKIYVVSLLAGVLAGVVYGLIGVRSPAPPVAALVGLLGMLLGEQGVALGKRLVRGQPLTAAWFAEECVPKITGAPPSKLTKSEDKGSTLVDGG
jgi:XapX domain-containing protein